MKKVIDLMALFGYEYIKEEPSKRFLFYEADYEQTVQIWTEKSVSKTLDIAVKLIKARLIERGKYAGRSEIRKQIKDALDIGTDFQFL